MRKHGFPSFPDPDSQGRLTLEMITQAGINLRQPAVLHAGDACVSVSHGQVTRGDVAQAMSTPREWERVTRTMVTRLIASYAGARK